MSCSLKFIKEYGNLSFNEMPFCDIDNIAICQILYLTFEDIGPNSFDDEPVSFKELYYKYFEYRGEKHTRVGLILPESISVQAMKMAETKRYSELKVAAVQGVFNVDPPIQFGAATFILPDGTLAVIFRGTDDSLIGWWEDVDLYTKKGIPSHKLAVDYLNEIGKRYDGDIIICGHSKGGNIALYGAMNCDASVRKRIVRLYNNDGPGFHNFDYIDSPEYKELLPVYRHYIPQSSLVGVLLAHDNDYTVVKSIRLLGATQHDMATWKVKGTDLVTVDSLTALGKISDRGLHDVFFRVTDDQGAIVDHVIAKIIEGSGQLYILGFVKNLIPSYKGAKKAWTSLDDSTKTGFIETFAGAGKLIKHAAKLVREDGLPYVRKQAENVATAVFA